MVNIVLNSCKELLSSNKRNDRPFISSADVGLPKFGPTNLLKGSRPLSQDFQPSSREVGGQPNTIWAYMHINKVYDTCLNLRLQFVVAVFVLKPNRDSLMNYWKKSNTIHTTKTYIHTSANYLSKHKKSSNPPKHTKKILSNPRDFVSMPDFFFGQVTGVHCLKRSPKNKEPTAWIQGSSQPSPFPGNPFSDTHGCNERHFFAYMKTHKKQRNCKCREKIFPVPWMRNVLRSY